MITVPFHELIDIDSEIWRLINKQKFPSLYPPNTLPDEIIENINSYFYDREIAYSAPEQFLRQWWRLTKERAYTWIKLLATEKVLRDDDMLFNYDLTEHSTDTRTGEGKSESLNTPNLKTVITPDLLNTNQNNQNQTTTGQSTQSGSSTDNQNQTTREMDTPDGITTDIESYVTRASKDDQQNSNQNSQINVSSQNLSTNDVQISRQTGTTTEHRKGEDKSESKTESKDVNEHDLRRYGNIGTMTVASVLGGYREAQQFDVYKNIIFPECEELFLHYVDLESVDIW